MARRVLDVTAHTTLEYAEATVSGPDWVEDGIAVVDAYCPEDGDGVVLAFEVDATANDAVGHHADTVHLTDDQARTLAADLVAAADAEDGDRPRRLD